YVLELEKLANMDHATNIYNRHYLYKNFMNIENKKAIMLLDLDDFKKVNDTHGHDIGDLVLKECARRIKQHLETKDILARVGGDEFTIVITSENKKPTEVIAKEIIKILSEWSSFPVPVFLSTSIGIYEFKEDHSMTID